VLALARDEAVSAFDGYIDVSFDLNPYGEASNARVLAGTAHDAAVEEDLLRQIRASRFRPGFEQGALVERSDVTLRYYFAR
jgi:outer membrane biosynthesis protein TonB